MHGQGVDMVRVAFLPFRFPGVPKVSCAFTTRLGGASRPPFHTANLSFDVGDDPAAVVANREAVAARLGFGHWQECRQVHGDGLHFEPPPKLPAEPAECEGDGLATGRPGQGLVIKTADCQPVLLAHRSGKFVAALHVGWRGNRLDFPASGVAAFCQGYGLEPGDLLAVRGPSLSPAASEFTGFEREFGPAFAPWFDAAARTVDLWRLTRDQLVAAGLLPENVFGIDLCTKERGNIFFSYRRDKTTGRQAGIIWIEG